MRRCECPQYPGDICAARDEPVEERCRPHGPQPPHHGLESGRRGGLGGRQQEHRPPQHALHGGGRPRRLFDLDPLARDDLVHARVRLWLLGRRQPAARRRRHPGRWLRAHPVHVGYRDLRRAQLDGRLGVRLADPDRRHRRADGNPGLPLWPYALCAALTGLGGGNYAASLANVNAFYPQRLKGSALAINAGVGNLGVAVIQLIGLLVLATAGHEAPYWVCAVYLVLLAIVGVAAALFMDNLDHGIEVNTMRSVLFERDTYVISLLYICTFGSWIGFAFAFGQVLQVNFLASGETTKHASLHAAQIAFVG